MTLVVSRGRRRTISCTLWLSLRSWACARSKARCHLGLGKLYRDCAHTRSRSRDRAGTADPPSFGSRTYSVGHLKECRQLVVECLEHCVHPDAQLSGRQAVDLSLADE